MIKPIPWRVRRFPIAHGGNSTQRYLLWPVRFSWGRPWTRPFTTHGWEVQADGFEQRVYGWTLHFGKLKVLFGKDARR